MKKNIFIIFIFIISSVFAQKSDEIKYNGSLISIENLLQKYIQIPSVSGQEKEAGDFIKNICKENGLHITDFGNENGQYNFAASIFPLSTNKPNIILLNHIDVVPENTESENGAYSGKIVNEKIYGRGAIDNKGAAVMQLQSIVHLMNDEDLNINAFNVTFLAVSCEETQCKGGVKYVIKNYFDILNPVVVIGEGPSELTTIIGGEFKNPIFGISVAHKRSFWLNLELIKNTSGHGSITPLNYSNKEMVASLDKLTKKNNKTIFNDLNVNLLKSLADHKKGLEKLLLKNPKFFKPILIPQLRKQPELFALFSNTITLTNIYTNSDAYNKIPNKTTAYLDCRLLPNIDENEFLIDLKKRLKNDSIKITITENMPKTKPSSIKNIYYKNLKAAILYKYPGSEIMPIMLPNINDLGAFRAKNIPAYASIPVYLTKEQVESIHNINEHISIKSLHNGAEVYYNFLMNMELEPNNNIQN
ncbi:MAG: M20/M25/M40 family metallo-hydrolase [Flavobacteriaceae bacterium]|nr:M20/M25/M40 family metallo-hydrolase [Flavobacteriaceae bacterium]